MKENKLPQANRTFIQKKYADEIGGYKSKSEFADILHKLRYTIGLRIPQGVVELLDEIAEVHEKSSSAHGIGATFVSYKTLAEKLGCAIRTVKDRFSWLKKYGFISIIPAWDYPNRERGEAYKVFSDAKTIMTMIRALVKHDENQIKMVVASIKEVHEGIVRKLAPTPAPTSAPTSAPTVETENLDIPTVGEGKNDEHIVPSIKSQYTNPLENINNKSIKEIDCVSSSETKMASSKKNQKKLKKWGIKKEVNALLHQDILNALHEDERYEFANRIQMLQKTYRVSVKEPNIYEAVLEASVNWIKYYLKGEGYTREDELGSYYKSVENAILDSLMLRYDVITDGITEDMLNQDMVDEWKYADHHEGKHGYNDENFVYHLIRENWFKPIYLENKEDISDEWNKFRQLAISQEDEGMNAYNEAHQSYEEMAVSRESQSKKPTRTELLPDWYDNEGQTDKQKLSPEEEAEKQKQKAEIENMLKQLHPELYMQTSSPEDVQAI